MIFHHICRRVSGLGCKVLKCDLKSHLAQKFQSTLKIDLSFSKEKWFLFKIKNIKETIRQPLLKPSSKDQTQKHSRVKPTKPKTVVKKHFAVQDTNGQPITWVLSIVRLKRILEACSIRLAWRTRPQADKEASRDLVTDINIYQCNLIS